MHTAVSCSRRVKGCYRRHYNSIDVEYLSIGSIYDRRIYGLRRSRFKIEEVAKEHNRKRQGIIGQSFQQLSEGET